MYIKGYIHCPLNSSLKYKDKDKTSQMCKTALTSQGLGADRKAEAIWDAFRERTVVYGKNSQTASNQGLSYKAHDWLLGCLGIFPHNIVFFSESVP